MVGLGWWRPSIFNGGVYPRYVEQHAAQGNTCVPTVKERQSWAGRGEVHEMDRL
jgi:hypothetical protein